MHEAWGKLVASLSSPPVYSSQKAEGKEETIEEVLDLKVQNFEAQNGKAQ